MKKEVKITLAFFSTFIILISGFLYISNLRVEIVKTHWNPHSFHILVRKFPLTDKGKINWWLENKESIFQDYHLPDNILSNNNIVVWRFGDGYKTLGKYDRLCFDDMPPPKNCIEKERLMYITLTRKGEVSYWLNGTRYIQKANGELDEVGFK